MKFKTYIEVEVEVEYDHQPFEPATGDYPGCQASIDIDYVNILTDVENLEEIKEGCWDDFNSKQHPGDDREDDDYGRAMEHSLWEGGHD